MVMAYRVLRPTLLHEPLTYAETVPFLMRWLSCSKEQAQAAIQVFLEMGIISDFEGPKGRSLRMNRLSRKLDLDMSETYRLHKG